MSVHVPTLDPQDMEAWLLLLDPFAWEECHTAAMLRERDRQLADTPTFRDAIVLNDADYDRIEPACSAEAYAGLDF